MRSQATRSGHAQISDLARASLDSGGVVLRVTPSSGKLIFLMPWGLIKLSIREDYPYMLLKKFFLISLTNMEVPDQFM